VARFVPPAAFEAWRRRALALGFTAVAAGPLVRSSYHAGELLGAAQPGRAKGRV
jgi:lipoic acid synthetase